MTEPYTGGCACGAIRYATKHARAEMALTGKAAHWEVAADSGNVKVHAFCPVCTYSARGPAWDAIDPSLQAFERMPSG